MKGSRISSPACEGGSHGFPSFSICHRYPSSLIAKYTPLAPGS
jgi:hypothetical protein